MEGEMKSRLALFGILTVVGLLAASVATASGTGDFLKFAGKEVRVVAMGGQLKIYENGKLVKEITIPEGEYTVETSEYKIVFYKNKMTPKEIEEAQKEHEKKVNRWLEIANKDSRVQELTNGKGVQRTDIFALSWSADEAVLMVKVDGKFYKITIDLNSEIVKSVEEQSLDKTEVYYGSGYNK